MRAIQNDWCTEVLGDHLDIEKVILDQGARSLQVNLIRADAEPLDVVICNTLGQVLYRQKVSSPVQSFFTLDPLPSNITYGNVYFISVRQGKYIATRKLIYL